MCDPEQNIMWHVHGRAAFNRFQTSFTPAILSINNR